MNDFLEVLEPYKEIKEIADIIDETQKLRCYYYSQNYIDMLQHINYLTKKYILETIIWNTTHTERNYSYEEQFSIAEEFLYREAIKVFVKYGIEAVQELLYR